MLYIMRILLEWVKGAKCISGKTEKRCTQWCQIYDQMASFMKKHANMYV
ncbi:hypothetical protein OESDEN_03552 [Oesophagostomum dentatum]|uniref:Uncharacterized protein n=1 Tax=Oesophagostomum dentatum TaxID=61180 RepID=A0A0B1TM47_OESDE|nr:hypothetical protein OESDEN_03552 [Oesophagostomum dentatum]